VASSASPSAPATASTAQEESSKKAQEESSKEVASSTAPVAAVKVQQDGTAGTATKNGKKRKKDEAQSGADAKEPRAKAPCLMVFGLGNASDTCRQQRHSFGARVVDALVGKIETQSVEGNHGVVGVRRLDGEGRPRFLLPPQSDINVSGEALKKALAALDSASADFLIIVDDCALPLGTIRFRAKGSSAGHNGLKGIETAYGLGYHRLKLGIGGKASKEHVVGTFAADETALVAATVERAVDAVRFWLSQGPEDIQALQSKLNSPDFCLVKTAVVAVPTVIAESTKAPEADTAAGATN